MKVKKEWMVYADGVGGLKPKFKHAVLSEAMIEASRLAAYRPGVKFLVVEIIGAVHFTTELGLRVSEVSEDNG